MKKIVFLGLVAMLVLFTTTSSQALSIAFDPLSQDVNLGEQSIVDVVISGLGSGGPDSLSTFDFDISFDPTILSLSSATIGDPVLGDQLDLPGDPWNFGPFFGVTPGMGIVNLFEVSTNDPTFLDSNQADTFILATLTFDTLTYGTSALDFSNVILGDSWGDPLTATTQSGSVNVIPEPATLVLLGSGLAGIVFWRRKRS